MKALLTSSSSSSSTRSIMMRGPTAAARAQARRASVAVRAAASSSATAADGQRKHVYITGGNTGIGLESAKMLAGQGFDVTLACRNPQKAAAAADAVRALAAPGAQVFTAALDLADLQSVRDAAIRALDSGRRIDVLLNNAGVMAPPRLETKDGFELQLGTNHLGHFLLTTSLLDALPPGCRIVTVASMAHLFGGIFFDDLQGVKSYDKWRYYGQSKLANILFTYELARRLPAARQITANTLHPGVVRTELPRYLLQDPDSLGGRLLTALATPFTLSPPEGARTSVYLASSPEVEGVTGKYFDSCRPIASSPASYDPDVARRLWQVSEELTAARPPGARVAVAAVAQVAA